MEDLRYSTNDGFSLKFNAKTSGFSRPPRVQSLVNLLTLC